MLRKHYSDEIMLEAIERGIDKYYKSKGCRHQYLSGHTLLDHIRFELELLDKGDVDANR